MLALTGMRPGCRVGPVLFGELKCPFDDEFIPNSGYCTLECEPGYAPNSQTITCSGGTLSPDYPRCNGKLN